MCYITDYFNQLPMITDCSVDDTVGDILSASTKPLERVKELLC
jgi:hypothetical protein